MQLCDTFVSNSVKTNTTAQKCTVIALKATRDYKGAEVERHRS
jgi:hypothetical protein